MKSTNLKIFWNFQVKRESLIFPLHFFFSFLHGTSFYALLILFFSFSPPPFFTFFDAFSIFSITFLFLFFLPSLIGYLLVVPSVCLPPSSSIFSALSFMVICPLFISKARERERERERARRREWERIKGDQSSGLEEAFASAGRARGTFFIKQEFKRTVGDFNPQTNSHRERERYNGDI